MTKQELYQALVDSNKFDNISPVAEWNPIGQPLFGVARYDFNTYKSGEGFRSYTVLVEDDGGANESATIADGDPLAPEEPAPFNIMDEANIKLEELVTAGTIVGFVPSGLMGTRFVEYIIYKEVNSVLEKQVYILWANPDNTIGFQKVG